jgi:2-oxoisovalerate dehydrogenase E1 component
MSNLNDFYRKMINIRCFEEKILELFSENKVSGTTHTCIGQEAVAVASMNNIRENDIVFSNHRCHGHYLAYGGPEELLMSEILSKKGGVCEGRGGSQHIHYKNFYSNGVQGGIVPNAAGMAWAEKLNNTENIAIVFIGDGTLGQGVVYETFNMASLYNIPILFIVENNQYAMTTNMRDAVSGSIGGRCKAFDIQYDEIESNDVEVLDNCFKKAINFTREKRKPFCQIVNTYRLGAHSKGDDTRDIDEIERHRKNDPIKIVEEKLDIEFCIQTKDIIKKYLEDIAIRVQEKESIEISKYNFKIGSYKYTDLYNTKNIRCVTSINMALDEVLNKNEDVILLGEDIRDSYGGAFKVTKGLSTKYSERIINTPISEAAITGVGVGLALNGKLPIIEMMFGDFVTLGFDQILNHATKYSWIYGKEAKVPIVIRTPTGGRRGYGPTHSQSLEKFLIGIPLITVMAISPIHNVYELYKYALEDLNGTLIIVENKKLYAEKLLVCNNGRIQEFFTEGACNDIFPTIKMTLDKESKPDVTLVTYGGTVQDAMEAALELMYEDEIQVDIVVVSQLSPIPILDLEVLLDDSMLIGTLEEGTKTCGWGSEIIATFNENNIGKKYFRIATEDLPIPNGIILENQIVPNKNKIINMIRGAL